MGVVAVGTAAAGAATVGVVTVGAATVGVIAVGAATVGAVTVGVVTVGAATTTGAMTMATPLAAPGLTTATCPAKLIAGKILTTHQENNLYSLIMFSTLLKQVFRKTQTEN